MFTIIKNLKKDLKRYRIIHSHGYFFPQQKKFMSGWEDIFPEKLINNINDAKETIKCVAPEIDVNDISIVNDRSMTL